MPPWFSGLIVAVCFSFSGWAQGSMPACDDAAKLDNTLIQGAGSEPIYLLRSGKKYGIQNPNWMSKNGYTQGVHVLDPACVAAVPSGYELAYETPIPGTPAELEDRLVSAPDHRVYLLRNGQRRWILNGKWIAESRYANQSAIPVSEGQIQALEPGPDITYRSTGDTIRMWLLTAGLFLFFFIASARPEWSCRFREATLRWRDEKNILLYWNAWHTRLVLLGAFVVIVVLRAPFLLLHPRFWAEEGSGWFQFAGSHSTVQTLCFVYPYSGYLNLLPNVAAIFASLTAAKVSLDYAPAVTTLIALLIHMLAITVILFGQSRLFDSLWKSVAGCLIVLFAPTATHEVWLNSINSMTYLGAITLVMLFQDTSSSPVWVRWILRAILALCSLSSPYAVVLAPLFVLVAWRDRDREKKIQSLILLCGSMVEAGVVLGGRLTGGRGFAMRGIQVFWDASMVNVFGGHIVRPSIGYAAQQTLLGSSGLYSAWASASSFAHPKTCSLVLAGWVCAVVIGLILWRLRGTTAYCTKNILLAAFVIFATLTCLTSLHSVPLGRYAFMPGLTFLLLLLVNVDLSASRVVAYVCAIVLSYGLATGIMDYREIPNPDGEDWSSEVRLWRIDHSHKLRIWPSYWQESITYSEPPRR